MSAVIPFDSNITAHKFIGIMIGVFALGHIIAHMGDFAIIAGASEAELDAAFGKTKPWTFPEIPTWGSLLLSWPGFTGVIMVISMAIAYLFVIDRVRRGSFNSFWYTHHLFGVYIIVVCLHGQAIWLAEVSMAWIWIMPGLLAYLLERCARTALADEKCSEVLIADKLPGKVLHLRIKKPEGFGDGLLHAGQYCFINIPALSEFEWHPFSLTSAPDDDFLSFHISALGDWTKGAYELMPKLQALALKSADEEAAKNDIEANQPQLYQVVLKEGVSYRTKPIQDEFMLPLVKLDHGQIVPVFETCEGDGCLWINDGTGWLPTCSSDNSKVLIPRTSLSSNAAAVYVDGPFGAPTQGYKHYNTVVLVGAGIGVTPFASILRHLVHFFVHHKCHKCGDVNLPHAFKLRKCYFHWITRDKRALSWFADTVREVSELDNSDLIQIHNHVTSTPSDLRSVMLRVAEAVCKQHAKTMRESRKKGVDYMKSSQTHFGRPNWTNIFQELQDSHPGENIGVFYCGPAVIAKQLSEAGAKFSANGITRFSVHKENF